MFINVSLYSVKDSTGKSISYEPEVKINVDLDEDSSLDINRLKIVKDAIRRTIRESLNWCIIKEVKRDCDLNDENR